jgi:hypothetical protein
MRYDITLTRERWEYVTVQISADDEAAAAAAAARLLTDHAAVQRLAWAAGDPVEDQGTPEVLSIEARATEDDDQNDSSRYYAPND